MYITQITIPIKSGYPIAIVNCKSDEREILRLLTQSFNMRKQADDYYFDPIFNETATTLFHIKSTRYMNKLKVEDIEFLFNKAVNAFQKELDQYELIAKYQGVAEKLKEVLDGTSDNKGSKS